MKPLSCLAWGCLVGPNWGAKPHKDDKFATEALGKTARGTHRDPGGVTGLRIRHVVQLAHGK